MTPEETEAAELEERARKLLTGKVEFLLSAPQLKFLPDPVVPEIAFAGRSNVGKSSLLNALTGRKSLARASVTISSATPLRMSRTVSSLGWTASVESDAAFAARAARELPERVRLVGGDPVAFAAALAGSPDVAVYGGPVTSAGRIELLPFLREQAVSITAHRYGNPDRAMIALEL